jgi:cytochrome P450
MIPGVAAAVGRAGRPIVRAAMKGGSTAYDEARRAGAEIYEHIEDVVAEIRAEKADGVADDDMAEDMSVAAGGDEPTDAEPTDERR